MTATHDLPRAGRALRNSLPPDVRCHLAGKEGPAVARAEYRPRRLHSTGPAHALAVSMIYDGGGPAARGEIPTTLEKSTGARPTARRALTPPSPQPPGRPGSRSTTHRKGSR